MAAVAIPGYGPESEPDQHVLLSGVPWSTYVMLRDTVDSPGVRMTYLEGWLEIMSPSRSHEVNKKQIARLLELFCLERNIPLYGYGSTTFRKEEAQRGLEPDECYCRDRDAETPDLALEVVLRQPALSKLEVYRGLGVREVWIFKNGAFQVFALRSGGYQPIPESELLPEAPLLRIAHFALQTDQHVALQEFRRELRA